MSPTAFSWLLGAIVIVTLAAVAISGLLLWCAFTDYLRERRVRQLRSEYRALRPQTIHKDRWGAEVQTRILR